MTKDYYEILGVSKTSGTDDIKKAYRKLAMKYHPDRGGDESRFKEISEAYAVLSDSHKRAQYDQFGPEGFSQQYSTEDIFRGARFEDFEDLFRQFGMESPFGGLFGSFFGGGFGRSRRQYGADLETELGITLEEAAKGIKKTLEISHSKACSRCHGSGAEPGSPLKTCSSCRGRGQVQHARQAGPMRFYTVTTCRSCQGQGQTVETPCKTCKGRGAATVRENVRVNVPSGVRDGIPLRLQGLGEAGPDGPGDLYVHIRVEPHRLFQQDGDDLYLDVPISYTQAVLGDTIEVPTLFGKAKLKIPAGTLSHTLFRLHGEGMPSLRGGAKGDQYVRVVIQIPKSPGAKEKKLLQELDVEYAKKHKGLLDGLFAF